MKFVVSYNSSLNILLQKANSIQYVDIPAYNDDDDDDAFLPASNMTTPAHVKGIIRQASVDSAGQVSYLTLVHLVIPAS